MHMDEPTSYVDETMPTKAFEASKNILLDPVQERQARCMHT